MCLNDSLYPNDAYLIAEKQHPIIENPVFFTLAFLITILLAVGFYYLQTFINLRYREKVWGRDDEYCLEFEPKKNREADKEEMEALNPK